MAWAEAPLRAVGHVPAAFVGCHHTIELSHECCSHGNRLGTCHYAIEYVAEHDEPVDLHYIAQLGYGDLDGHPAQCLHD